MAKNQPLKSTPSRILIAEDESVSRLVLTNLLLQLGHQVFAVTNGVEVLAEVARQDFDLILMDIHMPVMSGIDATEQLRRATAKPHGPRAKTAIVIIAMTASTAPDDRERAMAAGMNDCIQKPVDVETLSEVITKWLSLSQNKIQPLLPTTIESAAPASEIDMKAIDALMELSRDGSMAFLNSILNVHFTDNRARVEKIEAHMKGQDLVKLTKEAHALKASATNLGAHRLAALARSLEKTDLAKPDYSELHQLVANLRLAYEASCTDLQRIQKNLARASA